MTYLIIRLSSMGDVILTTPLITALKKSNPESKISFLTLPLYATLFKNDNRLVEILQYDKNSRTLINYTIKKFDTIIDLQNNNRSREIIKKYFTDIEVKKFTKNRLERFLLIYARIKNSTQIQPVIQKYFQTAGINFLEKEIPSLELLNSVNIKKDNKTIALMPFTAWKNKQWSLKNFANVGKYFSEKGWNILVVGGPMDIKAATCLKDNIGNNSEIIIDKNSLYNTAIKLKSCTLALGNDSGLSHLARACGVPTGMIFGPTTKEFGFYPIGKPEYKIFESNCFCRPCHPHGGDYCFRFARPCLRKISTEKVIKGLEQLINF